MELYIDTTEQGKIKLCIMDGAAVLSKSETHTPKISESLLMAIQKLLKKNKIQLRDLKKILVNPGPGGFSSTRTGVATANALNFALGIDQIVLPRYDKAPNITRPKNRRTKERKNT
mgnify:CR=1 FL=1